MSDNTKMLRAIINGQSAMKQELLARIDKVEKSLTEKIDNLGKVVEKNGNRIDKIETKTASL